MKDEHFKKFLEDLKSEKYSSALDIPKNIWESKSWDMLKKKESHQILLPLIKWQINRAVKSMPEIYSNYSNKKIDIKKIDKIEDFWQIPGLVKDSGVSGFGFREKISKNPYIMKPNDVKSNFSIFKSGGTRGVATPTFITNSDRNIETAGLKRCFDYMKITKNSCLLSTYNPTHKGGELIKESINLLGGSFIPRRITDDSNEIIKTIDMYDVDVLATVQGPIQHQDTTKKGGGVDFLSLVESGEKVLEKKMKTLFITGYTLIPEVINWAEHHKKNLATTLGSSECIPQATSTIGKNNRLCKYNNMHLINGPHYIEVVKEESGVLIPAKIGEPGILCYTTVAREGTIYIRYMPGDSAKIIYGENKCPCGIKSDIISDIGRLDIPEDIVTTGCCIG